MCGPGHTDAHNPGASWPKALARLPALGACRPGLLVPEALHSLLSTDAAPGHVSLFVHGLKQEHMVRTVADPVPPNGPGPWGCPRSGSRIAAGIRCGSDVGTAGQHSRGWLQRSRGAMRGKMRPAGDSLVLPWSFPIQGKAEGEDRRGSGADHPALWAYCARRTNVAIWPIFCFSSSVSPSRGSAHPDPPLPWLGPGMVWERSVTRGAPSIAGTHREQSRCLGWGSPSYSPP